MYRHIKARANDIIVYRERNYRVNSIIEHEKELELITELVSETITPTPPTPPDPEPTGIDLIMRNLYRDRPELASALLLYYAPSYQQELTNDYIFEQTINDGYFRLRDFSVNNNHLQIYGMSAIEGDGYINDEGHLIFDGLDDWGVVKPTYNGEWSIMADINYVTSTATKFAIASHLAPRYHFRISTTKQAVPTFYIDRTTAARYADLSIAQTEPWSAVDDEICVGRLRSTQSSYFASLTFRAMVMFNRPLTADEQYYVSQNLFDYTK